LLSRRAFALFGFSLSAAAALAMGVAHSHAGSPLLFCGLLCANAAGLSAHSFGFKANYLDLTVRHSGLFMGVGNSFATAMTFVTPLGVAHLMRITGGDWSYFFLTALLLSVIGGFVGTCCISVTRVDKED
jgi:hypothetical protein